MKKLLSLILLLAATCAQGQTTPSWQVKSQLEQMERSDKDAIRQQRWLDSSRAARAKRRTEIEAYNRVHPVRKTAAKATGSKP